MSITKIFHIKMMMMMIIVKCCFSLSIFRFEVNLHDGSHLKRSAGFVGL